MHTRQVIVAALTTGLAVGTVVMAQNGNPLNPNSKNTLTLAVYGDSPYGINPTDTSQTEKTLAFIDSINRDPKVDLVLHTGDIHSGKQFCTENYNWTIYNLWLSFKNPVIYTPGDNEWSDCHKAAQGGHVYLDPPTNSMPVDYADGDPVANLALVRSIFFAEPGYSPGGRKKQVLTQASNSNVSPSDTHYVENVMWEQSRVLFVTANVPGGSNNDSDNWYGAARTAAQTNEIAERTQADLHWLDAAFAQAQRDGVEAVVVMLQADMWDLDGKAVSHLSNYESIIGNLADHTRAFGKPVLLFNGDSHHYRSDNPLKQAQPCVFEATSGTGTVPCNSKPAAPDFTPDAWTNHPGYNVPNFHRVVVHGSTEPLEWLRLTITPGTNAPAGPDTFGPFRWERVQPLN